MTRGTTVSWLAASLITVACVCTTACKGTGQTSPDDRPRTAAAPRPFGPAGSPEPSRGSRRDRVRSDDPRDSTTTPIPIYADWRKHWDPYVEITTDGDWRVIRSNGLPDHATGSFPNDNNPHSILPQDYEFKITVHPQYAGTTYLLLGERFGVNVNGVVFDPEAAAYWHPDSNSIRNLQPGQDPFSEWQADPMSGLAAADLGLDFNHAHVQPGGAYHYHGAQATRTALPAEMQLIGWAFDGHPIYLRNGYDDRKDETSEVREMRSGYVLNKALLLKTSRPNGGPSFADFPLGTFVQDYVHLNGAGDLDECNGRYGMTPHFETALYHYFITDTFPYVPRCWKGTPTAK
jgi:hypothetical protein